MIYITREAPYTAEMLAQQFNRPLPLVKLALEAFVKFGMIEMMDDVLHVSNWEKYQNAKGLEKIREQTRARVAKHRENKKQIGCNVTETQSNVTDNVTETQGNATEKKEEKNKNTMCKKVAFALFEQLWELYPVKKGKGQVSDTAKNRLLKIGLEEMQRAIERYQTELKKDGWRKPQNGSTFFNSGYVD